MSTMMQALSAESSEASRAAVVATVKKAIHNLGHGSLDVEYHGNTLFLKGCCKLYAWRKDALETAKLALREAEKEGLSPDLSITDQIKVC